jgi:hypothetical protein
MKNSNYGLGGVMKKWCEIQICYSEAFKSRPNWSDTYRLKREGLVPILDKYKIDDFLTLDEPGFVLFRVEIDEAILGQIMADLKEFIGKEQSFSGINAVDWSPEEDARARILSAKQRAMEMGVSFLGGVPDGGWKILGIDQANKRWQGGPDDLERKVAEFSRFMARVNGQFTRAYLKEIEIGVDDPWMLSVFMHLLLDSISVWHNTENMARAFPFI